MKIRIAKSKANAEAKTEMRLIHVNGIYRNNCQRHRNASQNVEIYAIQNQLLHVKINLVDRVSNSNVRTVNNGSGNDDGGDGGSSLDETKQVKRADLYFKWGGNSKW